MPLKIGTILQYAMKYITMNRFKDILRMLGDFLFICAVFFLFWVAMVIHYAQNLLYLGMPIDKIQNLKDLEYYSNMEYTTSLVRDWVRLKPENEQLKKLSKCLLEISLYVVEIQRDNRFHREAISDYKYSKNKALLELEELRKKYEKLKDF